MNRLLLLDGHSILSRAYYGVPLLSTSTGIHTNAVYGFLNIMLKCVDDEKADRIAVAFDLDRHLLKRTAIYPEYKGTRKPMPAELLEQVPLIRDLIGAMGIPALSLSGYEADDILGTVAKKAQNEGWEVTIVSGDRDLLQLSDRHIKIAVPKTSRGQTEVRSYYPEDVVAEYQVTPSEFIDLKALMGDSSDNIPGLPGVGEKTATQIIVKFKSIENAREHADEVTPPRASRALKENFELARLSKVLATIDINVPLDFDTDSAGNADAIYTPAALDRLRELELKSLALKFSREMEKRKLNTKKESDTEFPAFKAVSDRFLAGVAFKDAAEEDLIAFRIFSGNDAGNSAKEKGRTRMAVSMSLSEDRTFVFLPSEKYTAEELRSDIKQLLAKREETKRISATLNLKDELKELGISRNKYIYDLSLALYLLDPSRNTYEYDDMARYTSGRAVKSKQELIGKMSVTDALYIDESGQAPVGGRQTVLSGGERENLKNNAVKLAAMSSYVPYTAEKDLEKALRESGMWDLYQDIELPLVYTLDHMEKTGIRLDSEALDGYALTLKAEIDVLDDEICEMAGERFNINSPKQLGVILFEKLGIPGGKKTKTGYSTAADVLEKISGEHKIVPKILRYRKLTKLYSTYAVGLNEFVREDGRIHGTFNQTITATGRISSTDPNLQNIPVRTEEGKEIRKVFIPRDEYVFTDADYSQVELRILASLSGDEALIGAYRDAVDIHSLTASQVFHVPLDEVTPEMRRNAKAVNFGIVYGISAFGLGEDLSIDRKEAAGYIERYFKSYPKVKEFLDGKVREAKEKGFVRTYFGRVRPIPELKSSNFQVRSFGERIAMNSPIQGTAADIMKIAMNNVDIALCGMKSKIALQVHDELLVETAPDEIEDVRRILKECMENAAELPVRLSVDIRNGDTWYDCH